MVIGYIELYEVSGGADLFTPELSLQNKITKGGLISL